MLHLIAAILSSCAISVGFKLITVLNTKLYRVVALNYLVATLFSFSRILTAPAAEAAHRTALFPWDMLVLAVALGATMIFSFVWTTNSSAKNGLGSTNFFNRIGIFLCILLSAVLWQEIPSGRQIIGMVILLLGLVEMMRSMGKSRWTDIGSLFLLTLSMGMIEVFNKVFSKYFSPAVEPIFLGCMFFSALCISIVFLTKNEKEPFRFTKKELLLGVGIGVVNASENMFKLGALEALPVSIVFPTIAAGTLLLVTLVGRVAFKDKVNAHTLIALALATVSIVLING